MDVPVSAKAALLQELSRGPGVAYELARRLRQATGGALALREASLYAALRALEDEREGLVTSAEEPPRAGSTKPRRVYRLTQKGQQVAQAHRAMVAAVFFELQAPAVEARRFDAEPAPAPGDRWVEREGGDDEEGDRFDPA
ncbi:PadR family transcriptional regulator [Sorangium sp. So ce134]